MKSNLRELPDNAPIDDRSTTAILIRDGIVIQAQTKAEKRDLAKKANPNDLLLLAWAGQWTTDIFPLPLERLRAV